MKVNGGGGRMLIKEGGKTHNGSKWEWKISGGGEREKGGEILGWIYKMRGYGMDSERIGLGEGRETRPGFESGVNGSLGGRKT